MTKESTVMEEQEEVPLFNTNQKMILVLVAGFSILIGVLIWLMIR